MKRKFDHDESVHRRLKADRYHPQRGSDVWHLRRSMIARARDLGMKINLKPRGKANPHMIKVGRKIARALGMPMKNPGLTKRMQEVIRDPSKRTKAQVERAKATKGRVRQPKVEVRRIVRNQSSRSTGIRLIVLHDTEGANIRGVSDLNNLGGWFDNPSAQASSHIAVDAEGNTGRYVEDSRKAWHCAAFNSPALGIEQVGFASQRDWPDAQLKKVAKWIAYWSVKYDIPIKRSTSHGVALHSDLGAAGGGHHDPGANYPVDRVLAMAREYARNGW